MKGWQLRLHADMVDGVLALGVAGRLGFGSSAPFSEAVTDAVQAGRRRMLIDLQDVDYISSAGLAALQAASEQVHGAGGRLVLCGLTEPVRFALDLAGLHGKFTVAPSRDAGIEWLRA